MSFRLESNPAVPYENWHDGTWLFPLETFPTEADCRAWFRSEGDDEPFAFGAAEEMLLHDHEEGACPSETYEEGLDCPYSALVLVRRSIPQ